LVLPHGCQWFVHALHILAYALTRRATFSLLRNEWRFAFLRFEAGPELSVGNVLLKVRGNGS
jgi:hypothetical protein